MPTESNRDFALVWSSVELEKGELGVVLYVRQNVSELIFKKKLLLLVTELVVILKYLDQLYDQPLHLQKWTIDLLFKNKKNLQTLDKF